MLDINMPSMSTQSMMKFTFFEYNIAKRYNFFYPSSIHDKKNSNFVMIHRFFRLNQHLQ